MYEHSASGKPYETYLAGNGLIQGKMRGTALLNNPTDVETMLFGIGSTNLTLTETQMPMSGALPDTSKVAPEYKSVSIMDLFAAPTVYAPRPLHPAPNQRPSYLN